MLKRVDMGTYLITKAVVEGKFEGGKTLLMDISNGGIGLTRMEVMKKALGDKFPQDILDRITALEEEVKSGKIKVVQYEGFQRD
jgi:basic membrane protein A